MKIEFIEFLELWFYGGLTNLQELFIYNLYRDVQQNWSSSSKKGFIELPRSLKISLSTYFESPRHRLLFTWLSRIASQPAFIPLSVKDEPSISTPRRTKRERSHSDENDHTPARKKSLNQNDNFGDKPFKCSVDKKCVLTFSTKEEALGHARVKHGYGHGCKNCSKAFDKLSKLNKHQSGDS